MNYSKDKLLDQLSSGAKVKYLFFWGHKVADPVTRTCFSQWYPASFTVDDQVYPTAEHWMMAEKARLFDDEAVLEKILHGKEPSEAKKLGREVRGFQSEVWDEHKYEVVVKGNVHKFSQNKELKTFLLNTGNRVLVEASPVDRIWGIGMAQDHLQVKEPTSWKGENLLGFALMEARDRLVGEK